MICFEHELVPVVRLQAELEEVAKAGCLVRSFALNHRSLEEGDPVVTGRLEMETKEGTVSVNRYIATFGPRRIVVIYWYQSRSRVIASEWAAKFWVIVDRLKEQRTDTSLVRVLVWNSGRSDEATTDAALGLAQRAYPVLSGLFAH